MSIPLYYEARTCVRCKAEKPANLQHYFAKCRNADGLDEVCKTCRKARVIEMRLQDAIQFREGMPRDRLLIA